MHGRRAGRAPGREGPARAVRERHDHHGRAGERVRDGLRPLRRVRHAPDHGDTRAAGRELIDEPAKNAYPTPLAYSRKEKCGVGRIRLDTALDNGPALWVSGDNLWKGALARRLDEEARCGEKRFAIQYLVGVYSSTGKPAWYNWAKKRYKSERRALQALGHFKRNGHPSDRYRIIHYYGPNDPHSHR